MDGAGKTDGRGKTCVQSLVQKKNPEGKRQLGRHARAWEDSIKTDLKKIR
jgi:hypothetical protein